MPICPKQVLKLGDGISENLGPKFPSKGGAMSRTPLPACPLKHAPLWYTFFALPAVNDPLPPELKFSENTAFLYTAVTSELLQYTTAIYCTKYCALSGLNSFFVTCVARSKYSNSVNWSTLFETYIRTTPTVGGFPPLLFSVIFCS